MKKEWPIFPTQISEYDKIIASSSNGSNYISLKDGVGLVDNLELKGLLTQMSSEFKNPCTIVEFTESENDPLFRTDSGSYKWDLRKTCQILRIQSKAHFTNPSSPVNNIKESFCHTIDNLHVNLFKENRKEINPENIQELINKYINSPDYKKQIRLIAGENDTKIKITTKHNRSFLEYDCPFLGYRELLFPIFVESRYLVGLLFVGEFLLEEYKTNKIHEKTRNYFFEYSKKTHLFDIESKIKKAIDDAEPLKYGSDSYLSNSEYNGMFKEITNRIKRFESRLNIELDRKRIKFISAKFEYYNRELLTLDCTSNESSYDLKPFWDKLKNIFRLIAQDFLIERLWVFSQNNFKPNYSRKLNTVYKYSDNIKDTPHDIFFSLDKINLTEENQAASSIDNTSLFNGFDKIDEIFDSEIDYIKIFPVNPQNNTYIILYIRYFNQWNRISEYENKEETFVAFKNAIESFFHIVSAKLSTLLANCNARINIDTLKIFGHEMAQFFTGIDSINEFYLKTSDVPGRNNYKRPLILTKTKSQIQDISGHLEGYLAQLKAINSRSKYLIQIPLLNKSYFWPYKELFYKWFNTNKSQLAKEKKSIIINEPKISDTKRPMIYADLKQLQHVFYNLVTNAIKYSFRGTNIYIDGQLNDITDEYVFFVKNYGFKIPDKEELDIYALYTQSIEAKNSGNEGLGIGLYISQKIAEAHEGLIYHTSELLSNYNIPLMWELNIISKEVSVEDKNEILKEFSKVSLTNVASEVVSCSENGKSFFHPSIEEIEKEIKKPTYRNTFIIRIPQNK